MTQEAKPLAQLREDGAYTVITRRVGCLTIAMRRTRGNRFIQFWIGKTRYNKEKTRYKAFLPVPMPFTIPKYILEGITTLCSFYNLLPKSVRQTQRIKVSFVKEKS